MAFPTFKVVEQRDHTFNVMLTREGRLKTITGFGSKHEAAAWVVQAGRMFQEADVFARPPASALRR